MGGFDTSDVAKIELHDFVAAVHLQTHCVWFQRRDSVKLAIEHVMIGGTTNYMAPRHEPCAAVFVVQVVVYLLVEFSSLCVAHRKAPVWHVVFVMGRVHQHPHAAFDVLID